MKPSETEQLAEPQALNRLMAEITAGLNQDEIEGFLHGLQEGMNKMIEKLTILEASGENVAGRILLGFGKAMKQANIQAELNKQRQLGTSAQWFRTEVKKGIIEAVNIYWQEKQGGSPIDIISTEN